MVDVQFQSGMALGDFGESRHEPDRQLLSLAGRPEPVERTIGPPALLMRLVEGEPKAAHAGALTPVLDDVLAIRALQIEIPEDAELVWMPADRLDRELVDLFTEGAGRVNHRRVDAVVSHLLQRVIHRVGWDLPVLRRHPGVFPNVDLGIDNLHRCLLRFSFLPAPWRAAMLASGRGGGL